MSVDKLHGNEREDRTRIVTMEEEAKIVTVLRDTEHSKRKGYFSDIADLIEVQIDTGMRVLEALELRYMDINFELRLITIRATKGTHRLVPMTKRVAAILKRRQDAGQLKPFNINEHQIRWAWYWVKEQMGLKDDKYLVLYALRMTCAYRLVNAGVDMEIVHDWLGYRIRSWRLAPLPAQKLLHAAELLEKWLK